MTDVARAWKADVACVAGLALAVAGFFPHVVIDWGVLFVQDMMVQNVPFRHFLHEALAAGRLPLWEPRINAGFPLFAEGQVGALYPPNWIGAALLSPAQAVTWSVLVHLWAAAAPCRTLRRYREPRRCMFGPTCQASLRGSRSD